MHALMETGCTWYTSSNDHSSEWQRLRSQLLSRHWTGATALHTLPVQQLQANWRLWLLPWVTGNFQHAGIQQTALIAAFKPPFRWVHEMRAAITAAIAASVSPPLVWTRLNFNNLWVRVIFVRCDLTISVGPCNWMTFLWSSPSNTFTLSYTFVSAISRSFLQEVKVKA